MRRPLKPWWLPSGWILLVMVLGLLAVLGLAWWDDATCLERGPEETTWMTTSCGKDCWTTYPVTTRPCVRRK